MKLFHNYTFYASSHSLLWSTIFLAMPFMSLYLYQLHCVEKQASDPRSYAPEQQSRQRMSSRTLIIDMQWHKKDIIPRYDKFPLHLCVLAQFQFRSQPPPPPPPLFCPSVNCPEWIFYSPNGSGGATLCNNDAPRDATYHVVCIAWARCS